VGDLDGRAPVDLRPGPNDTDPKRYSPKTIANIHGCVIFPVLKFAATKRPYLDANPAAGVELPRLSGRWSHSPPVVSSVEPQVGR